MQGSAVFGDFFDVLGVRPRSGRLIHANETGFDVDQRLAVITPDLEARLFGRESAVGRTIRANGSALEVVGVVDHGFTGAERGDDYAVWVSYPALAPLLGTTTERLLDRRTVSHRHLLARLAPGAEAESATLQVEAIMGRIRDAEPESAEWLMNLRPQVFPGLNISPQWQTRTRATLRVLSGVVLLVLLIACANVANLLIVRNAGRRGVLATRRALGASAGRIAREEIACSLILAIAGAAGGLAVAWVLAIPFRGQSLLRMPVFDSFAIDWRVLLFAASAALITTVLFGALPAIFAGRFDLAGAMRDGGGRETGRLTIVRWAMATGQVALSLTLVVGALLLGRTLQELQAVDTGFEVENVAALDMGMLDWPAGEEGRTLRRELIESLNALPSVEDVAEDMYGPHGGRMMGQVNLPDAAAEERLTAVHWPVSENWFGLFGVQLVAGRTFTPSESSHSELTAVLLSASLAQRLFGSQDAVGREIDVISGGSRRVQVVGVTEELTSATDPDVPMDAFFVPARFAPLSFFSLMVRTQELTPGALQSIRTTVEAAVPSAPVADPLPLKDRIRRIHSERRVFGQLLGILAVMAATLTAVGLYAVVAFSVSGRRREFGIRMALGAGSERIAGLVLRHTLGMLAAGLAAGVMGAYLLSAVLESRLFGVGRVDVASYGGAMIGFAVIAGLAAWIPARAATRVDPVGSLAAE